jgi:uncharacterized protein (TIRG00374 family)
MVGKMPFLRSRMFQLLLGLLVTGACLWWAISQMLKEPDAVHQLKRAFQAANYRSLPVILAVLFVFYWLKARRWRLLLSPTGNYRPLRDLFGPIMVGFGFNNCLPARIGEFLRCYVFSRQQKVPLMVTISSVVLERIFDGIGVVFYLAIGLLFVKGLDPRVQQAAMFFSACAGGIVLVSVVYVFWTKPFVDFVEGILKRIPFLPHGLTNKVCRILEAGAQGLSSLKDFRLVLAMLVLTLAQWGLNGVLVLLSLWSFGLPHHVPIAMVLMGAIAFGVALPSSPGYFGVMQVVFMEVMKFFTEDKQGVFAASVYYQLTQWIPVTATGLTFFVLSGLSLKQVEQTKQDLEEEGHD